MPEATAARTDGLEEKSLSTLESASATYSNAVASGIASGISNHAAALVVDSPSLPATIVSPAITPPATPNGTIRPNTPLPIPITSPFPPRPTRSLLPRLPHVECVVRARIPTTTGAEMFLHLYHNDADDKEHLAIVFGNDIRSKSLDAIRQGETEMDRMIRGAYVGRLHPGRTNSTVDNWSAAVGEQSKEETRSASDSQPPLVRIHSECYTGETAWSARCDCGEQLDEAARQMSTCQPPCGVIIYLRQEGRGIGLLEKLKAYNLQDMGADTVEANLILRHPADARSYGLATAILVDLGLGGERGIKLLTNNPDKIRAVEGPNGEVRVKERVPMVPISWRTGGREGVRGKEIEGYLNTKIRKMGHIL